MKYPAFLSLVGLSVALPTAAFSQSLSAIDSNTDPSVQLTAASIILVCSYLIVLIIYFSKSKDARKKLSSTSFLGALFFDFWFNEFSSLKLATFAYINLYAISIALLFCGIGFNFLFVFAGFLLLPLGRIVLEYYISSIKTAQNTGEMLDILRVNSASFLLSEADVASGIEKLNQDQNL